MAFSEGRLRGTLPITALRAVSRLFPTIPHPDHQIQKLTFIIPNGPGRLRPVSPHRRPLAAPAVQAAAESIPPERAEPGSRRCGPARSRPLGAVALSAKGFSAAGLSAKGGLSLCPIAPIAGNSVAANLRDPRRISRPSSRSTGALDRRVAADHRRVRPRRAHGDRGLPAGRARHGPRPRQRAGGMDAARQRRPPVTGRAACRGL